MDLNEASESIFLYDLFNTIEVDAFHCWFRFYSPHRDDREWIEVNVKLRLANFSLRLGLYSEFIVAETFRNSFGEFSTEVDPIERGGDTGLYFSTSFTDGETFPSEEGRCRVKESELETIRYKVIRKLRIEGLNALGRCGTAAGLS